MPLFFIIAGFFIRFDLSIKEFIVKDFKRLMMPYFLFSLIGLALETVKRAVLNRESLDYLHELKGIFIWMDMSSLINTYAFVLWFLPALFFSRFFLVVISKYVNNIFVQFLICSALFGISFLLDLPFGIDNALNAILFLFFGSVFYRFYQENNIIYVFPILTAILYFIYGIPRLDMATKDYGNIFVNILFSVGLVYAIIVILKQKNYSSSLIALWGSNTMLLFIAHPYTNNIAHLVVERFNFGDWYLKFFISITILQVILLLKTKFESRGVFKYV
jgi:fucose 4-O-acetylase-like acetyltransferase